MNNAHILAVLLTFIIYLLLAVAYFGWGKMTTSLLGLGRQEDNLVTPFIWIGWAFTLFIFQLTHFALPLTAFVVIPVLIIGVASAIPGVIASFRSHTIRTSKVLMVLSGIISVVLLVSFWVASRSMLTPENYDSGLYHFNKIRWINSFPVVPGLGNLHGRLAFNQSFFTYVAALNFFPFFGRGYSIANSFLYLLANATFIDLLRPVFKRPSLLVEDHPFKYTSIIIAFPILWYLSISGCNLSSPSPDFASIVLQLTMIIILAQGIGEYTTKQANQNFKVVLLGILATAAVTVKLSNLAFSAVIVSFVILYAIKPHAKKTVFRTMVLSAMMMLVWCVQGFILSGAPLYPSTIGYLPVDWAVPVEKVISEAKFICSSARQPNGVYWKDIPDNWNWFSPWLSSLLINKLRVVIPLSAAVLFLIATLIISRFRRNYRTQYLEWAVLLPVIIGLIYWFLTAPSIRFSHALFVIMPLCSILLFLSSLQNIINRKIFCVVICVILIVLYSGFAGLIVKNREAVKSISLSGWHPIKEVPLDRKITLSGLTVYTVKNPGEDQCWDSTLPSTPFFDAYLSLRNPNNMPSGFKMIREEGSQHKK